MKLLTFLALPLLFVDACKRALEENTLGGSDYDALAPPAKKRRCLWLPEEIFCEIFSHVFDDLPLTRLEENPVSSYNLVSKHWNTQLKSSLFRQTMQRHPRMALQLLHRNLACEDADLVRACAENIDGVLAFKLIFNALSVDALINLTHLPVLIDMNLSRDEYNYQLKYGVEKAHITGVIVPHDSFEVKLNSRKAFLHHFMDLGSSVCLDKVCPIQILKLMVIEDLFDAIGMTWIYSFVVRQISLCYHEQRMDDAKKLLDGIRRLTLPKSKTYALKVVSMYQLFLAAYIGDRGFTTFVNPNFDIMVNDSNNTISKLFFQTLKDFHDAKIDQFPSDLLYTAAGVLRIRKWYGTLGFSLERIRFRSMTLLQENGLPHNCRSVVETDLMFESDEDDV